MSGRARPLNQTQSSDQMQQGLHNQVRSLRATLWHWVTAAIAGVSALGLVRVLAPFLGFTVKVNVASLTLSAIFGTPGVVLLLLFRLFFWER